MFKSFFKETRWFLLIVFILTATLVGNVLYFTKIEPGTANPHLEEEAEEVGMQLTKLTDSLYSLTGQILEGDCERIAPQLPAEDAFTLILESPGGNLADGGCLASHIKLRNVVTVVRNTPILDDRGKFLYRPGLIPEEDDPGFGKTVCASACAVMFLGGDVRYLVGDVYLGIHGPRTPDGAVSGLSQHAVEAQTLQIASAILILLEQLGVEDHNVRRMFIQIPGTSMYFLNPDDFEAAPALIDFATHYVNFWGYNNERLNAGIED